MTKPVNIDTNEYLSWLRNGRTFQDVRDDLKVKGIEDADISRYIRTLDSILSKEAISTEQAYHYNALFLVGLSILLIGLCYTLYTYFYGKGGYLLAYGAILGGAGLMVSSRKKR